MYKFWDRPELLRRRSRFRALQQGRKILPRRESEKHLEHEPADMSFHCHKRLLLGVDRKVCYLPAHMTHDTSIACTQGP